MLGLPEPDELDALAPNSLPAIPENHTGIALHNGAISADGLHQGAGLVSNGASFSKFMTMLMDKIADKDHRIAQLSLSLNQVIHSQDLESAESELLALLVSILCPCAYLF
jgi:hypothetical protein